MANSAINWKGWTGYGTGENISIESVLGLELLTPPIKGRIFPGPRKRAEPEVDVKRSQCRARRRHEQELGRG